jgi:two-component system sensor histidine kinase RegB
MKLGHLIEEVVAPHRSFDVPIDVETHGAAPEPACARNPGLIYALANLVDNAVDFAASKVLIRASWTADEVKVEIRDDGPGFSPEVLLRVGEPYVTTRGRQSGSGEDGSGGDGSGLGLGLFIAKTLIERSGAQLSFANASPPGSGAVVRVVWPRTAYEGERPRLPASEAVTGAAGVSI